MQRVWEQVLGLVEERVGKTSTDTWLKPLRPLSVDTDTFHLEVPSALFRDWLLSHLVGPLEAAFREVRGQPTHLVLHVREKSQGELFPAEERKQAAQAEGKAAAQKNGLVAHYTFASFVVGGSNQFAHAAARAVSTHPGKNYNPLFIYGGVGLGKTHLINAIGHETLSKKGSGSVMYLSSESFTNELIAHLRRNRMAEFKTKFRRADVLILDDVQFLSGRERTQEEFFHTFNALHDANKQIILTSDKFPHEIRGLEERLRNRFEWGLIADIQPPDLETRVAILQKKARTKRIALPDEVALFIASHVTSNVRELEGGLTRLGALAALQQAQLTVSFAKQALHDLLAKPAKEVSIESVQKTVSKYFGIRVADITSKRRTKLITLPRQVAMFLCRKLAAASYPMIGMRFGGKDHTTVLHACHTIETRLKQDEELRAILTRIELMIAP
jgi:chromosomal replication initiator protein